MATEWNKDKIKQLLLTNDVAVERALVAITKRQTADEQRSEHTQHANGVGFAACDAKMMTSMGKQVMQGRKLSQKQLNWLRSGKSERFPCRIAKYAGQLLEIANEKSSNSGSAA